MKTQRVVQGSTKDGVGVVQNASVPWVSQDFRESKQPKTSCPFPPIILVSYKHTRLAQNTFEQERGVRKNETGAGVTTNFVNRWRCGQRHKIRGREGVKTK